MGIRIEIPQSNEALTGFVQFHDQVYNYLDVRWPAPLELHFPILTGDISCAPIYMVYRRNFRDRFRRNR